MVKALKKDATYADLVAVPEHFVAEIFDGELYASPRPASPHAHAIGALHRKLGVPFQDGENGPGGWLFLIEPELHFGANVLVPDVAAWRLERMPAIPDVPFFTLAPDWICEVLSPSTEWIDRRKKLPIYAQAGVTHAWLVDPREHTLEVLRCDSRAWAKVADHRGDGRVSAEPFAAVDLALRALWL